MPCKGSRVGQWFPSDIISQGVGTFAIDKKFLAAPYEWTEPEIVQCYIELSLTGTTGGGGGNDALPSLFPQVISQLQVGDGKNSYLVNLGGAGGNAGASLRVFNQHVYGRNFEDGANLGAGFSGTVRARIPIPLEWMRLENPHEAHWRLHEIYPLLNFIWSANTLTLGQAAANQFVIGASGITSRVWMKVVDRLAESSNPDAIKNRLRIELWEQALVTTDINKRYEFNTNRRLLLAGNYAGYLNENAGTPFNAQNLYTDSIDWPQFIPDYMVRHEYCQDVGIRFPDPAGATTAEDTVYNGFFMPWVWMRERPYSLWEAPELSAWNMQTDLSALPSGTRALFAFAAPRNDGGCVRHEAMPDQTATHFVTPTGAAVLIPSSATDSNRLIFPTVGPGYAGPVASK